MTGGGRKAAARLCVHPSTISRNKGRYDVRSVLLEIEREAATNNLLNQLNKNDLGAAASRPEDDASGQ